ncbi:hypothetical protein [Dyadobacter sp. CY323]|uniref:hypothetical protein n=1 Tax=Dyadobacter sp. CY323 TaxID=2907302 RepID=UPI001F3B18FD|nr:hypothetical protein [Dyadobacter sp. CY323]MCE6987496.1 hypothetical protein [Dyadobacter sp. CY323]
MKKVFIQELNATCQLVDSYQDLRKKDLISIVRGAYMNPNSFESKIELLQKLFICPPDVWAVLIRPENRDEFWRLIQQLDWILKGPDFRPVASIRIRGQEMHLPDNDLAQVKTAEFVVATAHLIGFHSAKKDAIAIESLARFMATIARPKPGIMERIKRADGDQDPREELSTARADKRADLFKKADLVTMIIAAQWFNNAANKMLAAYGMNGGDPEAAPISQGIFVQDWERQIVRVAESQVYGGYDQVMARPLADVLAFIELKNDELRRKAQAGKNGR